MSQDNLIVILLILAIFSIILALIYHRKKINLIILETVFNEKEAKIIALAFEQGKKNQKYWFFNQIVIPVSILYTPYFFTLINTHFETILFHKTLIDLTLTGALTIMGVNVMRTNLTMINEKLGNSSFDSSTWFQEIFNDNENLKSKLRSWISVLTFFASILYVTLVCGFILTDKPQSIYYAFAVIILFIVSVMFARILYVIQQNFAKDDEKLRMHFAIENEKEKTEYQNLKEIANEEGGLL